MIKQFKDVAVNEQFIYNEKIYKKIQEVKISCCKSANAQESVSGTKIQIKPLEEVSLYVVEDQQK
jgi:hypothetical protein